MHEFATQAFEPVVHQGMCECLRILDLTIQSGFGSTKLKELMW